MNRRPPPSIRPATPAVSEAGVTTSGAAADDGGAGGAAGQRIKLAPDAAAEGRLWEALSQLGVMHDSPPPAGAAAAVYSTIATGIAAAMVTQQVPEALAALCTAAFPGIVGIRLAMRVAPTVLAVTSSFMVAGPLTAALSPEHGSASGACLRTALPQLNEASTHGRRSPPGQLPEQCDGHCPCSVHVPCLPAAVLGGTREASAGADRGAAADASSCVVLDFHCHLLPGLVRHVPAMASLSFALEASMRGAQPSFAAGRASHEQPAVTAPVPMVGSGGGGSGTMAHHRGFADGSD